MLDYKSTGLSKVFSTEIIPLQETLKWDYCLKITTKHADFKTPSKALFTGDSIHP